MDHKNREFFGVDVGSAWVGIARGSSLARLAEPLVTVPAAAILDELQKLVKDHDAAGVVVGLPRGLNGAETEQTQAIRNWTKAAQAAIDKPFYWQDEALTSRQAESLKFKAKNSSDEHALAAAIILQDFLDTPKDEWVRC